MKNIGDWLRIGAFMLLAGCTAFPSQELTLYRDAFQQAKQASDILYDELAVVIDRRSKNTSETACVSVGGAVPQCFNPQTALRRSGGGGDPAIEARRTALQLIATYNLALADMVDGQPDVAWSARISELAALGSELAALASVPTGGLSALASGPSMAALIELASQLEQVRRNATARQSLLAVAPIIEELIDLLIADTGPVYDVYLIGQGGYARKQSTAEARQREFGRITNFHDALNAYVKLLNQVNASLSDLQKAVGRQGVSLAEARSTIVKAIEVRQAAETFWNSVRDLQR